MYKYVAKGQIHFALDGGVYTVKKWAQRRERFFCRYVCWLSDYFHTAASISASKPQQPRAAAASTKGSLWSPEHHRVVKRQIWAVKGRPSDLTDSFHPHRYRSLDNRMMLKPSMTNICIRDECTERRVSRCGKSIFCLVYLCNNMAEHSRVGRPAAAAASSSRSFICSSDTLCVWWCCGHSFLSVAWSLTCEAR